MADETPAAVPVDAQPVSDTARSAALLLSLTYA